MSVLVVIEHDRGTASPFAWEALTVGRELAESIGVPLEALVPGEPADGLADEAVAFGATVVHVADHDLLGDYGPEAWGETVAQAVSALGADVVLAAGTERGNEIMAQAAARADQAMVANVVNIEPGDVWTLTRVRWGGSLLEETTLDATVKMMTLAPHTREPARSPVVSESRVFEPILEDSLARTTIVRREVEAEGMTLATAPVVVGGGRGVGSAEGFETLEVLASLLGGTVGCSRVATNNGWRPHTDQVGQTGTKIAPTLYMACGISGAIQHWVGAMASGTIIAINTDPEANMVAKADFSVIGDLHEIVPAIAEEIRRRGLGASG